MGDFSIVCSAILANAGPAAGFLRDYVLLLVKKEEAKVMTDIKATNITWHGGTVGKEDRENLLGQKGVVVWFTGLSGSGKSTVSVEVEKELYRRGKLAYTLDGDNIRHGLNKNLGFSPQDRTENIRRIGEVAKLFADAGVIVLTAFISPYRQDREQVRTLLPEGAFIEAFVKCPLETCEARDVKGLYQKARDGVIKEFTGISAPYEEPQNPEIVLETVGADVASSAATVLSWLEQKGII
jgi:adenylylsulfate kinase